MIGFLNNLIYFIGYYILLNGCFNVYLLIKEFFLIKERDHLSDYGKDSWVVVTGATDGIGLAFVESFLKRKFKVIMISRNQQKLAKCKSDLENKYEGALISCIQSDFSNGNQLGFYEILKKKLDNFDISVLVNNVGVVRDKQIDMDDNSDGQFNHDLITINNTSQLMMSKIFLDRAMSRKMRSAQIDMSSIISLVDFSGIYIYSASKKFNQRLTQNLRIKLKEKVDFLVVKPGFVSTNMTTNRNIDMITCSPEDVAESSLLKLGNLKETYGHSSHVVQGSLLALINYIMPIRSISKRSLGYLFYNR